MNLSGILLQIKSPVVIAVFLIALFEEVFVEFLVDYLAVSRNIWLYILLKFLLMFLAKDKNSYPFTYICIYIYPFTHLLVQLNNAFILFNY